MVEIPVALGVYIDKRNMDLVVNPRPYMRVSVSYEDARKLFALEQALGILNVVDAFITYVPDVKGRIVGDLDQITVSNELKKINDTFVSSVTEYFAEKILGTLSEIEVFAVRKDVGSTFIEVPVFLDDFVKREG